MNNTDQFKFLLSSLATQSPIMVVCLVAGMFLVIRWKQAPSASMWALLGIGLSLALCFVIPIVQTLVQNWVMRGDRIADRAPIFMDIAILWSLLHALSYALLLVAVMVGRSAPKPQPAPPVH